MAGGDDRMKRVMTYLRPTLNERPTGLSSVKEFAIFWRSCSDEEKTEYAAGLPA